MPLPADVAPIERGSARDAVFEFLRSWIEDGTLGPGEVIKDGEIATALGLSRTPVREALQRLEQLGAVEMLPGRTTRVTDTTPEDILLVYGPLSVLQALATETGTPRATSTDIDEMTAHNERLMAAIQGKHPVAAREADRDFHGVLVRLADNRYLMSAIEPMLLHIRRLEALYFGDDKPGRESYREHKQIISAVADGDASRARELTRRNFERYRAPANPTRDAELPSQQAS